MQHKWIRFNGPLTPYPRFIGNKAIAPSDYWNYVADNAPDWMNLSSSDEWYEKQLRHDRDTNGKGYSEYGSLNYPIMSSLAGDLDGIDDWSDRGWVKFECEE